MLLCTVSSKYSVTVAARRTAPAISGAPASPCNVPGALTEEECMTPEQGPQVPRGLPATPGMLAAALQPQMRHNQPALVAAAKPTGVAASAAERRDGLSRTAGRTQQSPPRARQPAQAKQRSTGLGLRRLQRQQECDAEVNSSSKGCSSRTLASKQQQRA